MKKEIGENTRKWKDLSRSWIDRINNMEMVNLPKPIYRFNVIPIKFLIILFTGINCLESHMQT